MTKFWPQWFKYKFLFLVCLLLFYVQESLARTVGKARALRQPGPCRQAVHKYDHMTHFNFYLSQKWCWQKRKISSKNFIEVLLNLYSSVSSPLILKRGDGVNCDAFSLCSWRKHNEKHLVFCFSSCVKKTWWKNDENASVNSPFFKIGNLSATLV